MKDLALAKEIDSDNAYYNFLTSQVLLSQSIVRIGSQQSGFVNSRKLDDEHTLSEFSAIVLANNKRFIILNRKLFDLAMVEFEKGCHNSYLDTYLDEFGSKKKSLMCPNPSNLLDYIIAIYSDAGLNCSIYRQYQDLNYALHFYCQILMQEKKVSHLKKYLQLHDKFLKKISTNNRFFNLTALTSLAFLKANFENKSAIYFGLQDEEKAEYFRNKASEVYDYKRSEDYPLGGDFNKIHIHEKYGAYFVSQYVRGLFPQITKDDLKERLDPTKKMEYLFFEEDLGTVFVMIAFFIVAVCYGLFLICHFFKIFKIALPHISMSDAVKVFFYGGLIPLLIYLLIINFDFISNRNFNLKNNFLPFIAQNILLVITIIMSFVVTVIYCVKKDCKRFNILCPKMLSKTVIFALICYLFIFVGTLCFTIGYKNAILIELAKGLEKCCYGIKISIVIYCLLLSFIAIVFPLYFCLDWRKKYRVYKMFLLSKLSIYALLTLTSVALIHLFIIKNQERFYMEEDDVLGVKMCSDQLGTIVERQSSRIILDYVVDCRKEDEKK